jgi:hypothetical protein
MREENPASGTVPTLNTLPKPYPSNIRQPLMIKHMGNFTLFSLKDETHGLKHSSKKL